MVGGLILAFLHTGMTRRVIPWRDSLWRRWEPAAEEAETPTGRHSATLKRSIWATERRYTHSTDAHCGFAATSGCSFEHIEGRTEGWCWIPSSHCDIAHGQNTHFSEVTSFAALRLLASKVCDDEMSLSLKTTAPAKNSLFRPPKGPEWNLDNLIYSFTPLRAALILLISAVSVAQVEGG